MPASLQIWWERCQGEGPAAFGVAVPGVAGPGVAGPEVAGPEVAGPEVAGPEVAGPEVAGPEVADEAERLGWNPGPPARPCHAWVAPSARGVGFGVSGEDQDPSGSRRGDGTALAARQDRASGPGLAGPGGAGARGSGPAEAPPPASWAPAALWGLVLSVLSVLSGSVLSGSGLWRLAAGGGCGARRNHPAGGATPGHELLSAGDSPAVGAFAAGPSAAGPAGSSACGRRGPGTIRPGGTDQGGARFSGSSQRNRPVRCRSSSGEEP